MNVTGFFFSGEDAIQVFCDMTVGATVVGHDTDESTEVEACFGPACYRRAVNYSASWRQITALIRLSRQCRQSFSVLVGLQGQLI